MELTEDGLKRKKTEYSFKNVVSQIQKRDELDVEIYIRDNPDLYNYLLENKADIETTSSLSFDAEYDVIANEIDALREKKAAVVTKDAEQEMLKKRIEEMRQFLQIQSSRVTEYDEQMVRRLIEKITFFDDKLIFEFKSGMSIELKR
jgi:hypothetical protein